MKNDFKATIKKELTSFLISKGFIKMPFVCADFVDFYRDKTNKRELIAIQFDKHHRKRYLLEAGECELSGITNYGIHTPIERVSVGSLSYRVRLKPKRGHSTNSWFRTDGLFDRIFGKNNTDDVLICTKNIFAQVEDWFSKRTIGPNIFVLDMEPASGTAIRSCE